MKICLLILNISVLACSINAQVFVGGATGCTKNYLATDISDLSYTSNVSRYGIDLGISLDYYIGRKLSLKTSFSYLQKNYTLTRTNKYLGVYANFYNSYIENPLIVSVNYGGHKLKGFLNFGVSTGYFLSKRTKGKLPNVYDLKDSILSNGQIIESFYLANFDEKVSFNKNIDKRFEFGIIGGTGLNYFFDHNNMIGAEINYNQAITEQEKNYMINHKARINKTIILSFKYMRRLFLNK